MFNLAEYRPVQKSLWDYLPWAALIDEGVLLNKDGSFTRAARFRAPDMDATSLEQKLAHRQRLNNFLKRLESGWCLQVEAQRRPSRTYPESKFPDAFSQMIDDRRRASFEADQTHFEIDHFLVLTYLPPEDRKEKAASMFFSKSDDGEAEQEAEAPHKELSRFREASDQLFGLLSTLMSEVSVLDGEALLTYLHSCISERYHKVAVSDNPVYLDAVLSDTELLGGLQPRLGSKFLKVISVRSYPPTTEPDYLRELSDLPFAFRWSNRWLALSRPDAQKALKTLQRNWFAKRSGLGSVLRGQLMGEESALQNRDAVNKAQEADVAMQMVAADQAAFGYFTTSIIVSDESLETADWQAREVQKVLDAHGFVSKVETINAVDAWFGSLPAHAYADVRRVPLSSQSLADIIPSSDVWAGPEWNKALNGPALLHATTSGGTTPFRLSLHSGDVGHTMIIGPTGAGKSVLLSTIVAQFLRYEDAQVFVFDKGRSCRATCLALGGAFFDLGAADALAFQPLKHIDEDPEFEWALEWIEDIIRRLKVPVTPDVKRAIRDALTSVRTLPVKQRTLTSFNNQLQDLTVREAFAAYALGGPYGRFLDADEEDLTFSAVQAFEMEDLMTIPDALGPVISYLFHKIERALDGRPTLIVLDEAWVFLDDREFSGQLREWLKTLRKKNASVIFATQSLSDVAESDITSALIESCPTRLFLPNSRAQEPNLATIYHRFGLSPREIEILATAAPKSDYYMQSDRGTRLFQLNLDQMALAVFGASSPDHQALIEEVFAEGEGQNFATEFLSASGFVAEANELADRHMELAHA
ncbi:hypothetical protein CYMTET_5821 [Cymbomonas tetramitiformis]|uniref:AAA+ ATPase domain-containing protein n=1 Tax=Cymbomonas tetramitiformis TaxID=36881 RepID=A0AAE0LJ00_9CHLO|nr:hypothetical protein CYMTET_5821 [Cymbomonas tetramitiformis]